MAGELVTGSGAGSTAHLAAIYRKEAIIALADRASLRMHPSLVNLGTDIIMGADSEKGAIYNLDGALEFASVGEIATITNTALTGSSYTCTPARQGLAHALSDVVGMKDVTGALNPLRLGQSIAGGVGTTFTSLTCDLFGAWTAVGTTGVPFSLATVRAAQAALRAASVPGPYMMVLAPQQFSNFITDLDARGGHIAFNPATPEMAALRGPGFQGTWDGIEIFTSTRVNTSGSDYQGGIWGRGAIGFKEEENRPGIGADVMVNVGPLLIEIDRQARESVSGLVGSYRVGLCSIEAARGRQLLST